MANTKVFEIADAIIDAHNNGNGHAIKRDEVDALGGSKEHLDKLNVLEDNVHAAYANYFKAGADENNDGKALAKFKAEAFKAWRAVLGYVQPEGMKKLRISEYDLDFTLGDIKKAVNVDGKGTAYGITGKKAFRKVVESYIGCMIAEQVILTEDQTDAIRKYQGACKRIEKANEAILDANNRKAGLEATLKGLTGDAKVAVEKLVEDIQSEIDKADERKKNAQAVKKEMRTSYVAAKETLKQPIKVQKAKTAPKKTKNTKAA